MRRLHMRFLIACFFLLSVFLHGKEEVPPPEVCPVCGLDAIAEIVYGKPGTALLEQAADGRFFL